MPARVCADRKRLGLLFPVENDQSAMVRRLGALRRQDRLCQPLRMRCQPEISAAGGPAGTLPSALRSKAQRSGLRGRITGSSRRPVATPLRNSSRLETRRETPKILRQRPHHVIEALAHQHYVLRSLFRHAFSQPLHALRLQLLFQDVFEIFLAQQIQAVARDPGQKRVQHTRGEYAVAGVKEWPHQRQQQHPAAAGPAPGECVGVPGEISHRAAPPRGPPGCLPRARTSGRGGPAAKEAGELLPGTVVAVVELFWAL